MENKRKDWKQPKETVLPMEPVLFTNLTEQMVIKSKVETMKYIVWYVALVNDWNPYKNDGFGKVKNEIIRLAKCN